VRTCSGKPDPAAFEPGHAHTSTTLSVRYFCNTPILNARVAGLWLAASIPLAHPSRVKPGIGSPRLQRIDHCIQP